MVGKEDYEYAIPFYGERKPMLADLVFSPEEEIEKRYDTVARIGNTLLVDIFLPSFEEGAPGSGQRRIRCTTVGTLPVQLKQSGISPTGNVQNRNGNRPCEACRDHRFLPDATFVIDTKVK